MPSPSVSPYDSASEVDEYLRSIPYDVDDGWTCWLQQGLKFNSMATLALDILATPASEAYVERIFSVCGDLSTGKRNRSVKSLERKVFLKLNRKHIPQK